MVPELCLRTFEQSRLAADRGPEGAVQLAARPHGRRYGAGRAWARQRPPLRTHRRGRGLDDNLRGVVRLAELFEAFLSPGVPEEDRYAAETALALMSSPEPLQ